MTIKPGERWRTRDGGVARIKDCAEYPIHIEYPICGEVCVMGEWINVTWTSDGKFVVGEERDIDLMVSDHITWRDELAPIWAVLRPEIRWVAVEHEGGCWIAYTHKPILEETRYVRQHQSNGGRVYAMPGLLMPTPDCPWQDTLTERPA